MAEYLPITHAERLQHIDEERLVNTMAINETGADNIDEINIAQEGIRSEAVHDAEYYRALRESAAATSLRTSLLASELATSRPLDEMSDTERAAAIARRDRFERADSRTREIIKDILDPAIPTTFPHPPADETKIPRNYDTMGAFDSAFLSGLSPSREAITAAQAQVARLENEHASGRRVRGLKDAPPAEGDTAVLAYKELWDAQDELDVLQDGAPGYVTYAERRRQERKDAYDADKSETNRKLLEDATNRAISLADRRDLAYSANMAVLGDAENPHRHAQERVELHGGHAKKTDEAYEKALTKRDEAEAEVERLRRVHAFNPASSELAKAEDKLQRLEDALSTATSNRNENREAHTVAETIFNGLPGLVSRERIERRIGALELHEGAFTNAIAAYMESDPNSNMRQHDVFVASQGLHQYVRDIDAELAQMKPDQLNYSEVVDMRAEALKTLIRCTFVAEHLRLRNTSKPGDTFEGRYEARHMTDGSHGILIERSNGNMVVYADGSFARFDHTNKLGHRMKADGTYWKPDQPTEDGLFGYYEDEVAKARRFTSKDNDVRNAERRNMSMYELEELRRDITEAWVLNQDNQEVAAAAFAVKHENHADNVVRINRTTDFNDRLDIIAENNVLEYEARVIDHVSLGNKHGRKRDFLDSRGVFRHIGKHYGHEGRWMMYHDGSLTAYDIDRDNNIVVQARFSPSGQRISV